MRAISTPYSLRKNAEIAGMVLVDSTPDHMDSFPPELRGITTAT
jgi:hypothetical protein